MYFTLFVSNYYQRIKEVKYANEIMLEEKFVGSVAERVKASFLRRPRSHDLGLTRTLVMLLRPWIRRFAMIISAWRTSSKFTWEEVKH